MTNRLLTLAGRQKPAFLMSLCVPSCILSQLYTQECIFIGLQALVLKSVFIMGLHAQFGTIALNDSPRLYRGVLLGEKIGTRGSSIPIHLPGWPIRKPPSPLSPPQLLTNDRSSVHPDDWGIAVFRVLMNLRLSTFQVVRPHLCKCPNPQTVPQQTAALHPPLGNVNNQCSIVRRCVR